jgi:hypothetical protein
LTRAAWRALSPPPFPHHRIDQQRRAFAAQNREHALGGGDVAAPSIELHFT